MTKRIRTKETTDEEILDKSQKEGKRIEGQIDAEHRIIAKYKKRINSPTSAIRAFCVECMGASIKSVADCTSKDCSLLEFRMGTNTFDIRSIKAKEKREKNAGH